MPWYKKVSILFLLVITQSILCAEGIKVIQYSGYRDTRGEVIVSALFEVDLPEPLKKALVEGVSLDFILDYDLLDKDSHNYFSELKRFFGINKCIRYKLSYHSILNKYQLSVNGYVTNYDLLSSALKALGQLVNFNLTEELGYKPIKPEKKIKARLKLAMITKDFSKLFKVEKLILKVKNLDSGWIDIDIMQNSP